MNNYGKFFVDFLTPFFNGLVSILKSFFGGILEMLNIVKYSEIIKEYKETVSIVFIIIAIICLILLLGLFSYIVYYLVKKIIKVIRKSHEQDALLEEVEKLNYDMIKLKQENDKLTMMAQGGDGEFDENGNPITKLGKGESRFFKLTQSDKEWENAKPEVFRNDLNLEQICDNFRNYAASE